MGPAQVKFPAGIYRGKIFKLAKHCFANLIGRIDFVKLADIFQICHGKTFSEVLRQVGRQFFYELLSVSGAVFPVLFFLHDLPPDLLVGIDHREVDSGLSIFSGVRENGCNTFQKAGINGAAEFLHGGFLQGQNDCIDCSGFCGRLQWKI